MTINEVINSGKIVKVFGLNYDDSQISEMKCRFGENNGVAYSFPRWSYPIYIEEQDKLFIHRFYIKRYIYYTSFGTDWFKSANRIWFLDKQKAYEEAIKNIREKKRELDKKQMLLQIELSNFKDK